MVIGSRQRLSVKCDDLKIKIDDQIIKRVDYTKSLGLTIDAHLSWSKHVEEICEKSLRLQAPLNEFLSGTTVVIVLCVVFRDPRF